MGVLKDDIHKLVDSTSDTNLLEDVFMILSSRNSYNQGELWTSLTDQQRKKVLQSESQISNLEDWISNDEVKNISKTWLKK